MQPAAQTSAFSPYGSLFSTSGLNEKKDVNRHWKAERSVQKEVQVLSIVGDTRKKIWNCWSLFQVHTWKNIFEFTQTWMNHKHKQAIPFKHQTSIDHKHCLPSVQGSYFQKQPPLCGGRNRWPLFFFILEVLYISPWPLRRQSLLPTPASGCDGAAWLWPMPCGRDSAPDQVSVQTGSRASICPSRSF